MDRIDGLSVRSLTVAAHNVPPSRDRQEGCLGEDPVKLRDAASQFEALMLAQMLKCAQQADSEGWLGTGDDQTGGLMLEVAQEHLSQVLASQGGLGLASLIVEGLSRQPCAAASLPER
jgi:Rod binding domain-containing protein